VDGPLRHHCAKVVAAAHHEEPSAMQIATIVVDLAKHVFQVHGVDRGTEVVCATAPARQGSPDSSQPAALPRWHGGFAGVRTPGTRECGALGHRCPAHSGPLREGLREAGKNDTGRCRGNLRAVRGHHGRSSVSKVTGTNRLFSQLHRTRELLVAQSTCDHQYATGTASPSSASLRGRGQLARRAAPVAPRGREHVPEPGAPS
jgi:transposase